MENKTLEYGLFTGERALFASEGLYIKDSTFADGESPLKESRDIELEGCIFKWKYPLWYCESIACSCVTLLETARSGIWYTRNISISDSLIEAPKTFRRSSGITLKNCRMPKAQETLWSCRDIVLDSVTAAGDYFAMNAENIKIRDFELVGNYGFDGAKNIEIRNAKILSKDAFWNAENVTVYDSLIVGEYLGWNSRNVTFINCTVDSNQGMCYMNNVRMENCKFLNTDLAFEYSDAYVTALSPIDSVKNPSSGKIIAPSIGTLIMEPTRIDPAMTEIVTDK